MPAQLAESPLTCVAVGSGRSLEEFEVDPPDERATRPPPARGATDLGAGDVPQAGTPAPRGPGRARRRLA